MRAYAAADEEALRAQGFLRDWTSEGFVSEVQREEMARDIACGLRRTNGFLRVVLFLFALITAGAAAGLFFVTLYTGNHPRGDGVVLLVFGAICYAGTEYSVYEWHLYRHGIEEALAVASIGFLCAGLQALLSDAYLPARNGTAYLVPVAGAVASFFIYRRFGFRYLFPAAMIFIAFVPGHWTTSHSGQHMIVAGFYAAGLLVLVLVRREHRLDFLDEEYSAVEAMLWLGLYLALNLQLSPENVLAFWQPEPAIRTEFSGTFYWMTYGLVWCLPAITMWRALTMKDRTVWLGVITTILTLVTNKAYLGWPRHPWDPMLLGVLLAAIAIGVKRWLADGPAGVRHGFTARRLSGRDKQLLNTLSAGLGIALPNPGTVAADSSGHRFGGGDADGGGASSTF